MQPIPAHPPVIPPLDPLRFVHADLFGATMKADPAPTFLAWAQQPPFYVMIHDRPNLVLCRYADVTQAFIDHSVFSRVPQPGWGADTFDYFNGLPTVGDVDPPEHSRLRKLMWPAFTPRRLAVVQTQLEALIDKMMDELEARSGFDMAADFAQPLVRRLLLGIVFDFPEADWHVFTAFSEALGLVGTVPPGAPKPRAYLDRFEAGYAYCQALIDARRREPRDDLVGSIIAAHHESGAISVDELFGALIVLFAAGIGTTSSGLGLAMLRLCRHPDQLALLREQPDLINSAVEECLRIDTLGMFVHRYVVKDTEIGGTPIHRGMLAHLGMGAANLDPMVYPEPARFDITRNPRNVATFGFGPHLCIGHALARNVMRTAIARLVRRFPRLRLAEPGFQPQFGGLPTERMPLSVPVRID
jgi:cytochrome P450